MKEERKNVLIIGIGNSGRKDDGLGWAFVDNLQGNLPTNYDFEYRYQLQIEDAEMVSRYDTVVFVDAHKQMFKPGYVWERCEAKETHSFTSHELPPETIMFLAKDVFYKEPNAYILGISGKDFALDLGMSSTAKENLSKALDFFKKKILKPA